MTGSPNEKNFMRETIVKPKENKSRRAGRAFCLVLFAVIAIVRQFLEPKLLGHSYGLHPLVTLLSLYAGGQLFGFLGLLVFPALTLLLYELLFFGEKKKEVK